MKEVNHYEEAKKKIEEIESYLKSSYQTRESYDYAAGLVSELALMSDNVPSLELKIDKLIEDLGAI